MDAPPAPCETWLALPERSSTSNLRLRYSNSAVRVTEMAKATSNASGSVSEFVTLARVFKTQGRRGEVAVELHSDVPDRFREGLALSALATDGGRREVLVADLWPHKGALVLKFAGIDSMSDAEKLIGCELQV